jgi:hypothetical protein
MQGMCQQGTYGFDDNQVITVWDHPWYDMACHTVTLCHGTHTVFWLHMPAGAKLWAGVEELKELLESALRDGPGIEGYAPPACLPLHG